jgi:hypothetical protein
MNVARRNFLSMLAAVPFMSSFESAASECPAANVDVRKNFYVWIHGMFGVTFQSSQILLVSPQLPDNDNRHIYKVGRANGYDEDHNIYCGTQDLTDAGTYFIDGLGPLVAPTEEFPPDIRDTVLYVRGTAKKPDSKTFCFVLPYPQNLIPLRPFDTGIVPGTNIDPLDPHLPNPGLVPLTHVFEYDNVSPDKVRILRGDAGGNVFWEHGQSSHLHIYAEPDPLCDKKPLQCQHDPVKSFQKLLDCYDDLVPFMVQNNEPDCVRLSNIMKFASDLREQFGLFEWFGQCQEQESVQRFNPRRGQPTRGTMDCPQLMIMESPTIFNAVRQNKRRFDTEMKALKVQLENEIRMELQVGKGAKTAKPLKRKAAKQTK